VSENRTRTLKKIVGTAAGTAKMDLKLCMLDNVLGENHGSSSGHQANFSTKQMNY
jgi:hypothetical protein